MGGEEAYGARAAAVYAGLIDPLLGRLRRRVSRLCKTLGVRTVVDIACATGAQCRGLHAAGLEVTGVDLSASMLLSARRRSSERISFVHASALALPFEDDTFDAAILSLALHEHPEGERRAMVAEAMRVTGPDGLLVLADYQRPPLASFHPAWWAIRWIEHQAGGDHAAGFLDFMAHGGLEGLVRRMGFHSHLRRATHGGAIAIVAVPGAAHPAMARADEG